MSKKKKGKIIPLKATKLSPEKYIKTQARTLPVFECFITAGWEDAGISNIFVARKHKTGNITVGIYLVDMYCLGIKDANYEFNISPDDYEYLKYNSGDIEECDYTLVHNIIYGAIEFAGDYGFKPHQDFAVSQFILEEDDERVELMEIEFGLNGMPCFIPGPYDDDSKIRRITATLERTAGPGNFEIMDPLDDDGFDEDDEFDDYELDEDALIEDMNESYRSFIPILKKLNKIYDGLMRTPEAKEKLEKFPIATAYKTSKGEVKTEYNQFDNDEQRDEYHHLNEMIMDTDNYDIAIKGLKKAIAKYPDRPLFYDLLVPAYNFSNRFNELEKLIIDMYKRFPDYLYAMTAYANLLIDKGKADQVLSAFKGKTDLNYLYPERKTFQITEAAAYYACMCRYYIAVDDIDAADLYMNAILKKKFTEIPGQTLVNMAVMELCDAKMKKIGEVADASSE